MKTIVKESIAMIVLVASIMLITVLLFFDYIKLGADQPQSATYQMTIEEQNLIAEKEKYEEEKDKLILSSEYSINAEDLSIYKASGDFSQGQSSPFDEMPITDVLYDRAGNAYYNANNTYNTTTNSSSNGGYTNQNTVTGNYVNTQTPNINYNTGNNGGQTSNTTTNGQTGQTPQISYNADITTSSPSSGTILGSYSGAGK